MIQMQQVSEDQDVQKEFQKAKTDGGQPICPHFHKSLEISQIQYESIDWKWNNKKKIYEKEIAGLDPDKPFCTS